MSAIFEAVSGRGGGRMGNGQNAVPALWRGTVSEVAAGGIWCTIPHLASTHQLGPLPSVVPGLQVGTRVVVAAIEGRKDDLLILAAL